MALLAAACLLGSSTSSDTRPQPEDVLASEFAQKENVNPLEKNTSVVLSCTLFLIGGDAL